MPDLEDYTGNNPVINWDEPLDEQLYELWGFEDEHIQIIEDYAVENGYYDREHYHTDPVIL